jgi:hypothetical protein
MPTARYDCLVAVLPTNEVMIVGGDIGIIGPTDKNEIVNFRLS